MNRDTLQAATDMVEGQIATRSSVMHVETQSDDLARTGILTLPNELLAEIFMWLKGTLGRPPFSGSTRSYWHRVNLVCRGWRNLAIATPVLWTDLPTWNHDSTLMMLERSKLADLDVHIDFRRTKEQTAIAVMNNLGRIRSLSISQDHYSDLSLRGLLSGSNQEAGRLEDLQIFISLQYSIMREKFVLSADLRWLTLQLRTLVLHIPSYDWKVFPLPNLTCLCILDYCRPSSRISIDKFIEALSQMQQLQRLKLSLTDLLRPGRGINDHTLRAYLPRLSSLELIYRKPQDLTHVLSHLTLPRLSYATITCNGKKSDDNADYSNMAEAIGLLITNGDFGICTSYGLSYSKFDLGFLAPHHNFSLAMQFPIHGDWETRLIEQVPLGVSKVILQTLSSVSRAEVMLIPSIRDVLHLLGTLPVLTDLTIHDGLVPELTKALTLPSDHLSDTPPPFAKLASITFSHVDDSADCVLKFRGCLIARRNHAFPINTIRIKRWNDPDTPSDTVSIMRDFGGKLIVEER